MQRKGGVRRKSRHKFRKNYKRRGKISVTDYLQEFNIGDKVILKAEPAVQKSLYAGRYHGSRGLIRNKRGACYEVGVKMGKKEKMFIVHPVHLKRG